MSFDTDRDIAALVAAVREGLDLSVESLGAIVNCHPMTVYKWSYGTLSPAPYQQALLRAYLRAVERGYRPGKGRIAAIIANDGVPRAMYEVLRHAGLDAKLVEEEDGTNLSFDREPR